MQSTIITFLNLLFMATRMAVTHWGITSTLHAKLGIWTPLQGNLQKKLFFIVCAFTLKKTRVLTMRKRGEWSRLRDSQNVPVDETYIRLIQGLSIKRPCLSSALRNFLLFLKNNCFLSIFSNLAPWNSIQSDSRPPGLNICVSYPFCSHFYHWFLLCIQRNYFDFILFLLKSYINWM